MATTTFDCADPFEGVKKALEALSKAMIKTNDLYKIQLKSLSTATAILEKNLSVYKLYQPQIIDTFNLVAERNRNAIEAVAKACSVFNNINLNNIVNLSLSETLSCVKGLQTQLPLLVNSIEKIQTEQQVEQVKKDESVKIEPTEKRTPNIKVILDCIVAIITILDFFLGLAHNAIPEINVNITNNYSVNYYIEEVNSFYYNGEIDTRDYNDNGYRFVAEKTIMPRVKPDCKSTVVDKLPLGKVVLIVDKYKKWVQIRWKNADDTFSYGWVQNYKLSEFKE